MGRSLYGHDCKPRSKIGRNLLIGATAVIILVAFVWATYDPQTFMRLNGIRPEAKNMQPVAEPQPVNTTQRSALRDKTARR
jgi:hypothetical protein